MRIPRLAPIAAGFALTAAVAAAAPGTHFSSSVAARPAATGPAWSIGHLADVAVRPGVQQAGRGQASPPTTADSEKAYKVPCYQPARIRSSASLRPRSAAKGLFVPNGPWCEPW